MPERRQVSLTEGQRAELEAIRDHHPKAYLRERAEAILKVYEGRSVRQVAEYELRWRHEPETVSRWINRYEEAEVDGLVIKPGRGRKLGFSFSQHSRNRN